ncbi:hypothetical protein L1887_23890 [Cichorium endivia]|nr:hypothetical protein L1887_23890 [Cichorium endivia]
MMKKEQDPNEAPLIAAFKSTITYFFITKLIALFQWPHPCLSLISFVNGVIGAFGTQSKKSRLSMLRQIRFFLIFSFSHTHTHTSPKILIGKISEFKCKNLQGTVCGSHDGC